MLKIRRGSLIHKWTDIVNGSAYHNIETKFDALLTYVVIPLGFAVIRAVSLFAIYIISLILYASFQHSFGFGMLNIFIVLAPIVGMFLIFGDEMGFMQEPIEMKLEKSDD